MALRAPLTTPLTDANGKIQTPWQSFLLVIQRALIGISSVTTVGAAGTAAALPAKPTGYVVVNVNGTEVQIPYYTKA